MNIKKICRMSVGAPAKINIACPNVATWYSIYRPLFHTSKRSSAIATTATTTAVLSKSSVSQLGTVIGLFFFSIF
jgi:hypothetical protein